MRSRCPSISSWSKRPDMQALPAQLEQGEVDVFVGLSDVAEHGWVGRTLFTDTFLAAQRKGHPRGGRKLSLSAFCAAAHLVVSSTGDPFSGFVDTALAKLGRRRQVVMSTESYATAPALVANTDLMCTLPGRLLQRFDASLDLFAPPLALPKITIRAYWHPRSRDDAASVWFRTQLFQAAGVSVR
ncbi:LysR substrate-binding domain-containing protein [Luteimonas sp. gir]|uniref:LysR substrate-binding domain-containing protein n=1 Tax=Luteimonas sp. gir TaxID=3127960 RepID=UPI003075BE41